VTSSNCLIKLYKNIIKLFESDLRDAISFVANCWRLTDSFLRKCVEDIFKKVKVRKDI
jgi:hypothetical protein